MSMSRSCKEAMKQSLLGQEQYGIAPRCFIGLLTHEPEVDNIHEVAGVGYSRMLIGDAMSHDSQLMGEVDVYGTAKNTSTIFFNEAESEWGTITHFALFKQSEGGEPYMWGTLTEPIIITSGYVPLFKAGDLSFTLQ